jgi:hypothetical protein
LKRKYGKIGPAFIVFVLVAVSVHVEASDIDLLVNGGFEKGTMNGWTVVGANPTWSPPHYNPPYQYEGDFFVYINPNDHGDITVSQQVTISTACFTLGFAVLPHTGGQQYIRAVYVTAYDSEDNFLIDDNGRTVELLYSLVGNPTTSGYKMTFNLELRDPNTEPYYYFQRNFNEDYQEAGGNPTDWEFASYIIVSFTSKGGGGGTSWDGFSLIAYMSEEEMPSSQGPEISQPKDETPEEIEPSQPSDEYQTQIINIGEEYTLDFIKEVHIQVFDIKVEVFFDVDINFPENIIMGGEEKMVVNVQYSGEPSKIVAQIEGFVDQSRGFAPSFVSDQLKWKFASFDIFNYYFTVSKGRVELEIIDKYNLLEVDSYIWDRTGSKEIAIRSENISEINEKNLISQVLQYLSWVISVSRPVSGLRVVCSRSRTPIV